jgi:hypothetical protein
MINTFTHIIKNSCVLQKIRCHDNSQVLGIYFILREQKEVQWMVRMTVLEASLVCLLLHFVLWPHHKRNDAHKLDHQGI